jgi:hypothetical protein
MRKRIPQSMHFGHRNQVSRGAWTSIHTGSKDFSLEGLFLYNESTDTSKEPAFSTFNARVETMVVSDIKQDIGVESPAPAQTGSRLRLYFYLAPLILVPLLILAFAIVVVPTQWFAEHSGDPFLVILGYGAQLRNADCRIVIYGDSTAEIGINPEIIQERTGLSACNIAETEGMTMINGTMVLDQFLEHNQRPQFIVFLYAPESLNLESQRHNPVVTTFEAVTYRFRQPNKLMSVIALMRHPEDFFSWAIHGARWAMDSALAKPLPRETRLLRFRTHGQSALKDPVLTSCSSLPSTSSPDKVWVDSLRSKYSAKGTTVLVDAMLLPVCDPGLSYFQRELSGVVDNKIGVLPVSDYYAGGRHANPMGSVPLSKMVADQILKRLQADPATGAH